MIKRNKEPTYAENVVQFVRVVSARVNVKIQIALIAKEKVKRLRPLSALFVEETRS